MSDNLDRQTMKSSDVILYRLDEVQEAQKAFALEVRTAQLRVETKLDGMPRKDDLDAIKRDKNRDHADFEKRITALENLKNGITSKITVAAVTMLILMVLALYGLDRFIKL